jgi:hypothetical protein
MTINYKEGTVTNKTVVFEGETDEGQGFSIYANWNDWDDWSVDEISWHNPDFEPKEEETESITEEFLSNMN